MSHLDQKTFDQIVARTRLGERLRDAARRVLVDGESQAKVAREVGVQRQTVQKAVSRVMELKDFWSYHEMIEMVSAAKRHCKNNKKEEAK